MASAKKCDICGAFYEYPVCNDSVRIQLTYGCAADRYVDLCDDCYTKLIEFVKPTLPKNLQYARYKGGNDA